MGPLVIESISSCPEYLQLSRHLYLSGVPTVLESTSSCPKYLRCREHLQLSNSRKYLHMPRAVNQSTSSCRGDLQIVGNISVCQEQLSGEPRLVEGTSNSGTCREQLSGVPRVVEGTSNSQKYLRLPEQLSGVPRVVEGTSISQKYLL